MRKSKTEPKQLYQCPTCNAQYIINGDKENFTRFSWGPVTPDAIKRMCCVDRNK